MIGEFIGFMGSHIKNLIIKGATVAPLIFRKLLNLMPNLEFLELDSVGITRLDEPKKFDLLSGLKQLKTHYLEMKTAFQIYLHLDPESVLQLPRIWSTLGTR
jgi:hypothetical protein